MKTGAGRPCASCPHQASAGGQDQPSGPIPPLMAAVVTAIEVLQAAGSGGWNVSSPPESAGVAGRVDGEVTFLPGAPQLLMT